MKGIKISGLGKAVPKHAVSNEALCEHIDSSDEWIFSRTGIRSRRVVTEETMTSLSVMAAGQALLESKLAKEQIDLVIVATATPDNMMPSTACEVARQLGIEHASCFDLSAACSGFIYSSQVAISMLRSGMKKKALVIGSESLSRFLNYEDRSSCILFGDGAGAVLYEAVSPAENEILAISTGSRPEGSQMITLPVASFDHTFSKEVKKAYLQMDGRAVYCFATTKVPEDMMQVLQSVNMKPTDIDWYILHQANCRIMDSVAKKLKVDSKRFYKNLEAYGNTSAASIPMALYDLRSKLKCGDKLILSGFGAGLTWGTMLLRWGLSHSS